MTIAEYIKGLDQMEQKFKGIKEQMLSSAHTWSNEACKGYAYMAMTNAGLNEEQIHSVLTEMSYCFNDKTIEEAEEKYTQI